MNYKKIGIKLCIFFIFTCGSFHAIADGKWVDCKRTQGYYQYFNSTTVQVGKDSQVGDMLGTWLTSSNPTAWTCVHRANSISISPQMAVQGYPPYRVWGTTQTDGQTYNVYATAVKAGLGYIARWRYRIKGQSSEWYSLTVPNGVYQTPAELFNVSYDDGQPYFIGIDVQIRFVKTADSLRAGTMAVFDPLYLRHMQISEGATDYGTSTYMIAEFLAGGLNISTTGGTCTTPDVYVNLPMVSRSEFTGIGYTTAMTNFNLRFKQCPAGLASIGYSLTPVTAILDSNNGLFAPDSNSTASGIAFKMLNEQDIPVSFNTLYLLNNYDPNQDNANYDIPLKVGLYQTQKSVSSGNVSGAVTFTVNYK
ncbi:fimbrial protein [Klebsiella pneumoniae]|nr:fimbrial protein [Klebsiella pneumoniae]